MKFCSGCGKQIEDGATFCPACGKAVGADGTSNNAGADSGGFDFNKAVNDFTNTADTTASYDSADINANKTMAVLAYIPLLFFIPLVAVPQSRFGKYHANQGLIFTIAAAGGNIAIMIVSKILRLIYLGFLGEYISWAV